MALSSAEAEFYAMVDGVLRAKWVATVAQEMGFTSMGGRLVLGTDSSAAKSFVSRRGLGRMRHVEVRELWLQKEVMKGLIEVIKIPGQDNPADLMTKFLHRDLIEEHLKKLNIKMKEGNVVKRVVAERKVEVKAKQSDEHRLVKGRWADEDVDQDEEGAWRAAALWMTNKSYIGSDS